MMANGNKFKELKKSPLYNLSLCSLENFHTNFLVWLGNTYKKETFELLTCKEQKININNYGNITFEAQTKKEKNCIFDLCVKENEKIILILENKIKSYPTEEQLIKYNNINLNPNTKILLTMFPYDKPIEKWTVLTYFDLAENSKKIFEKKEKNYNESLIEDYFTMIENISEIVKETIPKGENSKIYDIYTQKEKLQELNDIYVKYRTDGLKEFIKSNIEKYLAEKTPDKTQEPKYKKIITEISTDFSHNQGIVNIDRKYFINKEPDEQKNNYDFILTIQIQGNDYRYCMIYGEKKEDEKRFNFAKKLKGEELWFNGDQKYTPKAKYAKVRNSEEEPIFRGYAPNFIYNHKDIETIKGESGKITYEKIAQKVQDDLDLLNKKEQEIIKCYNEHLKEI